MSIRLVDDRETALRIGYDATEWSTPVDFEAYEKGLEDWAVKLVVRNEQPVGAMFSRDDEIHFSILPKWRKKWLTKQFLRDLFDNRRIVTRVTPGFDNITEQLERLGFEMRPDGLLVKEAHRGY
jgi:hypothetical protein